MAAYDSVVREIAIVFPHSYDGDQIEYGPPFERVKVPTKVCRMVNALHTLRWAKYGSLSSCVIGVRGGRQGCKLGGVLFNTIFSEAMSQVRSKLSASGISKRSCRKEYLFWGSMEAHMSRICMTL